MIQRINKVSGNSGSAGFTLIELVAVLIVIAVIATFAVARYISFTDDAVKMGFVEAVNQLNGKEKLAWSRAMLDDTDTGVIDDDVFTLMCNGVDGTIDDFDAEGYAFLAAPAIPQTGAHQITYNGWVASFNRTAASPSDMGYWTMTVDPAPIP